MVLFLLGLLGGGVFVLADRAAGQMQVVDISGLLLYSCDYV